MRDPAPWQKRYDTMWALAIILGIIGQYLFVNRAAGASVPIFIALFYVYFFFATQGRRGGFDRFEGQSKTGWLLFAPIGLLALSYIIYANTVFRILNAGMLLVLLVGQTILLTRGGSQPWYRPRFAGELLRQWLITPLTHLGVPFGITGGWLRGSRDHSPSRSNLSKVGLGLLLAAPLLFVVILLLASADGIFMSWLNRLPSLMDGDNFENGIHRLLFGACAALYLFCFVWGLLFKRDRERALSSAASETSREGEWEWEAIGIVRQKDAAPEKKGVEVFDPIVAATVLISVNVVYVLFAAIQFTYLFGAADGLLPEGTAYAEYARRGFGEMVMIALINICILLVGLHFVGQGSRLLEIIRKLMLTVLMGCTLVMLISAYWRLSLYEEAYGYTQLRLLVHGFMVFLSVLMLVAVARIWYRWFSLAKIYMALGILSYVIMNYINVDARVASFNSERYEATGKIDIHYLSVLSADAAPALIRLRSEHPELEQLDRIIDDYRRLAEERGHWQSWSLSLQRLKHL